MAKEIRALFVSPVAYAIIAVFLLLSGYSFAMTLIVSKQASLVHIFFQAAMQLVLLVPILTMRLFAEERSSGTLEMLLTAPIRDWQVVFAKFFACYAFYVLMWLPTLLYLPVLTDWQWWTTSCAIDPWPVVSTYLGLALAGAMFLTIGMLISSFVKSQMVAALVSLFIGLLFVVAGIWRPDMDTSDTPYQLVFFFTVPLHFERNFGRGLIDTRNLILYGSIALLGLFLTVRSLESRRWR